MKISRKQLRKLIQEAVINEMPMIKPGGEMDPDHLEKLTAMIDTGDESNIRQADELASMVGHDSDNLSQDLQSYDSISAIGKIADIIQYLTQEDMAMLTNVAGEDLVYALHSWSGFGFSKADLGGSAISPDDLFTMAVRAAAKKQDLDEADYAKYEGADELIIAQQKLVKAIIRLSKNTVVNPHDMEDGGIGEVIGGTPEFWDNDYKELWQSGKLLIEN